jgi:hypothetical protein
MVLARGAAGFFVNRKALAQVRIGGGLPTDPRSSIRVVTSCSHIGCTLYRDGEIAVLRGALVAIW